MLRQTFISWIVLPDGALQDNKLGKIVKIILYFDTVKC